MHVGVMKTGADKAAPQIHQLISGLRHFQHFPGGAAGQNPARLRCEGLLQGQAAGIDFAVVVYGFHRPPLSRYYSASKRSLPFFMSHSSTAPAKRAVTRVAMPRNRYPPIFCPTQKYRPTMAAP